MGNLFRFLAGAAWIIFILQMSFAHIAPWSLPLIVQIHQPFPFGMAFWETLLWWFAFPVGWLTIAVSPFVWLALFFENMQIAYWAWSIWLTIILGYLPPAALMYIYTHKMNEARNLGWVLAVGLLLTVSGAVAAPDMPSANSPHMTPDERQLYESEAIEDSIRERDAAFNEWLATQSQQEETEDEPENETETLYITFKKERTKACHNHAKFLLTRLTQARTPEGLMFMRELGPSFCKWCKDLDKDEYRAVCPK